MKEGPKRTVPSTVKTAFQMAFPWNVIDECRVGTAVDIIDQLSTTFKICHCTMYIDNFLDYPSQLYLIAKNFTGETGTVEKIEIG